MCLRGGQKQRQYVSWSPPEWAKWGTLRSEQPVTNICCFGRKCPCCVNPVCLLVSTIVCDKIKSYFQIIPLLSISMTLFFCFERRELALLKNRDGSSLSPRAPQTMRAWAAAKRRGAFICIAFRCFIFQKRRDSDEKRRIIYRVNERKTASSDNPLLMSCRDSIMHQIIILFALTAKRNILIPTGKCVGIGTTAITAN